MNKYSTLTIEGTKVGISQVNTMDIEGFMPLNSCSGGCGCKGHDEKAHKKDSNHKCCHDKYSDDHKHEGCNCGHK